MVCRGKKFPPPCLMLACLCLAFASLAAGATSIHEKYARVRGVPLWRQHEYLADSFACPGCVAQRVVVLRLLPHVLFSLLSSPKRETQKKTLLCRSGVLIARSKVNDDYCDCASGGDEPGTSACSALEGTAAEFWCPTERRYVRASRVDDGHADCCDGADESARGAAGAASSNACLAATTDDDDDDDDDEAVAAAYRVGASKRRESHTHTTRTRGVSFLENTNSGATDPLGVKGETLSTRRQHTVLSVLPKAVRRR